MSKATTPRGRSFRDYIEQRKKTDPEFAKIQGEGYEEFKAGVLLRMARRKEAKMTQEQVAEIMGTKKSFISRIENKNDDIRVSTFFKFLSAVGKELRIA